MRITSLFRPKRTWSAKERTLHRNVAAYGTSRTRPQNFDAERRCEESQEYRLGNNKNSNQKQPGEKESGKFHYNPGNMSGKTAGTKKEESEPRSAADKDHGRSDAHTSKKT